MALTLHHVICSSDITFPASVMFDVYCFLLASFTAMNAIFLGQFPLHDFLIDITFFVIGNFSKEKNHYLMPVLRGLPNMENTYWRPRGVATKLLKIIPCPWPSP